MTRLPHPMEMLTARIHADAKRLGVALDTYDPDALLATVFEFLAEHDAVLTPVGLVKSSDFGAGGGA